MAFTRASWSLKSATPFITGIKRFGATRIFGAATKFGSDKVTPWKLKK